MFSTEEDYSDSLESIRIVQTTGDSIVFQNQGDEATVTIPAGLWYPVDLKREFELQISDSDFSDILSVEYNHSTKKFKFEVSEGNLTYDESVSGLATKLNISNSVTPTDTLESSSAVDYYSGPEVYSLFPWKPSDPDGVIPEDDDTKIFIGPRDLWNRALYPAVIVDIGGGSSKDFNIGKQDVGYEYDDDGVPIKTIFAGAWENVEMTITILAKSFYDRDLIMDFISLAMVFTIKEELARVGFRISSSITAGGLASFQDADDPGEIVYTGTVSTNFFSEWEMRVPFRGSQNIQNMPGQYFGSYPETTPTSINRIVVSFTEYED